MSSRGAEAPSGPPRVVRRGRAARAGAWRRLSHNAEDGASQCTMDEQVALGRPQTCASPKLPKRVAPPPPPPPPDGKRGRDGGTTQARVADAVCDTLESARHFEVRRGKAELFVIGYALRRLVRFCVAAITSEAMATFEVEVNKWAKGGGAEKLMRASLSLPSGELCQPVLAHDTSRAHDDALLEKLDIVSERLAKIEAALSQQAQSRLPLQPISRHNQGGGSALFRHESPPLQRLTESHSRNRSASPTELPLSQMGRPRSAHSRPLKANASVEDAWALHKFPKAQRYSQSAVA